MAAHSDGVDWSSLLKILQFTEQQSPTKHDIVDLCSTIVRSQNDIIQQKDGNHECCSSFVLLAANFISGNARRVAALHLDVVSAACRILLQYLVGSLNLSAFSFPSEIGDTNQHPHPHLDRCLRAIRLLCNENSAQFTAGEIAAFTTTMKGETAHQANAAAAEKEASNKQDAKTRTDLSANIFEQLTMPIRDADTIPDAPAGHVPPDGANNDPASEINRLFLKANRESLQAMRAGDTLVDLCLSLPAIKKTRAKIDDALAGKPFQLPLSHSEATGIRNTLASSVAEINLISSAVNLPVLEPLTTSKLEKLCNLSMSVLYCAVSQAAAASILSMSSAISPKCTSVQTQSSHKEDDLDANAVTLVEEALNLYSDIGAVIKNSTRAGGHVYQNYLLAGTWVLVSGLQGHMSSCTAPSEKPAHLREDKGRSPSKSRESSGSARSGLVKFQHSFGVLSVALATRALALLSELFDDLNLEVCGSNSTLVQVDPAPISITGQFSALQRVAKIMNTATLNQLFFYLALVSYRKACTLKRIHPPEGDTFSQSDSTTYYEDMILCSDVSSTDEDDDSEPILGQWFEETLAPPESSDSKPAPVEDEMDLTMLQTAHGNSIVPEKGEAHGFIKLATNIFTFMNKHFLLSKSGYVARYIKTGITEQQIIILAVVIRDLDRETARTEVALSQLYSEFSGALSRFTHNLVTNANLQPLQASLLSNLGVSPWSTDVPHGWPLQVYPRTLSVLAQIVLMRPQNEREASVISMWHRLVNTLIENVVNGPNPIAADAEIEDLNVEHAQVLVYLFHSLNLLQKKSVVLLLAGGLLRCSEVVRGALRDSQLLHLSRLLLLFDYIMKHLYDAPQQLLEQILFNLFHSTNLNVTADKESKENNMSRMYIAWQWNDSYAKTGREEFSMKPTFYVLSHMEINNQDAPKLDGLACSFILGTPDKLRYPLLLDALIKILSVTDIAGNAAKMSRLGLFATQYCFSICWKLLQMLPPSIPYLESLEKGKLLPVGPVLLYSLIWGPRCGHKNFSRWLKDCLVKQGLYTQNAERLVKTVADTVNTLKFDIDTAMNCITTLTPTTKPGPMSKDAMPPLWHLYLLHAVVAKVQVSLRDDNPEPGSAESAESAAHENSVQELLPHVLRLAQVILHCTRWSLLHSMVEQSEPEGKATLADFESLQEVLAIATSKSKLTVGLVPDQAALLPAAVNFVIQQWHMASFDECNWSSYMKDIIVSESFLLNIVDSHIETLSASSYSFSLNLSLKCLLQRLLTFVCTHAPQIDNTDTKNKVIELLVSTTLDCRTEFLHEHVSKVLEKMIGDTETDEHQKRVYMQILDNTYKLITNYSNTENDNVNEKILHNFLKFYERLLEKAAGRQALEAFFTGDKELVQVLMSVSNSQMSPQYSTKVLHLFNKLFNSAERSPTDPSLNYLCSSMSKLADIESDKLQTWLRHVIIGPTNVATPGATTPTATTSNPEVASASEQEVAMTTPWQSGDTSPNEEVKNLVQENSQLLQALTNFIVKPNSNISEIVATTILKALVSLGTVILASPLDAIGFTDLMVVMTMLADAGTGSGHIYLFTLVSEWWVEHCSRYLTKEKMIEKFSSDPDAEKDCDILDALCSMLDYMSEIITWVMNHQKITFQRPVSPPWENETPLDQDPEFFEEVNDEEDSGEESDEDSLCNRLCTFTITQKEFMNQHWYHCHTCRMLDGVGVCSVCARVCHKGHDVTYAKYGNFFCDCGAKEDGSCQALVKRSPQTALEAITCPPGTSASITYIAANEESLTSSLRKKEPILVAKDKSGIKRERKKNTIVKKLDGSLDLVLAFLNRSGVPAILLGLLQDMLPVIEAACKRNSRVGCYSRAMHALQQLHSVDKKFVANDQLMVPTLGSQEGAFENVRMNYAGEQGQTIRQLLSAHMIRRVTMCCMSSPQSKRQHLAVAHEKGKISILQLSALLKQADSSTRKLTLTRLASAPIPFTVLSLTSNLCNSDYLAVCGLKDCHVLTFNASGAVVDHLVLHPQLASGNFIIKAVWLPGPQTKLALVTPDFVKIYDLSKDALSPQYYFLVPSGKIRDCTFMFEDGKYNILLMSSPGHIYTETLNEESSAKHGSFYVTNTLEVFYVDLTDVNGLIAGGGVSIYYSHTLKLLFYSYVQGKSFVSPVKLTSYGLAVVFPITLSSAAKGNGGKPSTAQPLCQWMEIPNHPGLICAVIQASNNPVVLMLKPDSLAIQEVKVTPAKSKIIDIVAIRHASGLEQRTTLMLLCEDGSLKMYMANMEHTGYWMSPHVQTSPPTTNVVKPRRKKVIKPVGKVTGAVNFPVDFFEHCTPMNDVEIGGNDLLQIYNVAQLKHRLNTNGLYVVCTKDLGFQMEITNPDSNQVMMGIRVLIGTQDPQRAPTFIEVFGRIIPTMATRSRWFDIPFSREESLQADKKIFVSFGPSQDPETVTILESIKIYGKMKEAFGWPEETEETMAGPLTSSVNAAASTDNGDSSGSLLSTPNSKLDKLIAISLDVLDGSFCLNLVDGQMSAHRTASNEIATKLLTLPIPPYLQLHATSLLSSLYTTTAAYHAYKDHELLQHVLLSLKAMNDTDVTKNLNDLDAESFYRLVMMVRGIAVNRPQNLVKFTDSHTSIQDVVLDDPLDVQTPKSTKNQHLLMQLMDVLWLLHSLNPKNSICAPVVVPGLKHTELVVYALVEIVHAFNSCDTYSNITIAVYLQLLLCDDPVIAFSAKHALSRVLRPKSKKRKVFIPSPPHCVTPPAKPTEVERPATTSEPIRRAIRLPYNEDAVEFMQALQHHQHEDADHNVNLEALLGGGAGFQPLLDIPLDADDETMVELAIALSLQEHELGEELAQVVQEVQQQEAAGHLSDTTASAGGSDDEGSTAATDGSTLRTSPAEQGGGSAGSESGGSGVESMTGEHNFSGRSSTYGDATQEPKPEPTAAPPPGFSSSSTQEAETVPDMDTEQELENSSRLHILRLQLLERLIEYIPKLKAVTGVRAVPFFQVILQLTNDLDGHLERDKACLSALLQAIIVELNINCPIADNISERSNQREVQLVILRLLSVMMTKWKSSANPKPASNDNSSFVPATTATVLLKADFITHCLKVLQSLLEYWKETKTEDIANTSTDNLLKVQQSLPAPDMSPIFLKQFVKGQPSDIFQVYPQLLTEMALRLPYQVHKHSEIVESVNSAFESAWFKCLCEYMMFTHVPSIRRLVRKLLLFICGSKDKYRQLRDIHALNAHVKAVKLCCIKGGFDPSQPYQHAISFSYDRLVEMVEHLKACLEIGTSRVGNWQNFCLRHNDVLSFLYQVSCVLDEGVAPTILQLLNCAIVMQTTAKKTHETPAAKPTSRKAHEKSDDSAADAAFEEATCVALVEQINQVVPHDVLVRFIRTFLLETNNTVLRWHAHSLISSLYKHSKMRQKEQLLELLWQLWPLLPTYGSKASQFVDLLGYYSLKMSQMPDANIRIASYVDNAVQVLRTQNELLAHHPNANLYAHLNHYVDVDGYYLESDPCLVCNNPEIPMSTIKLSSIKVDAKFTTTTQIVKLLSSHTISRITIRIGDLKRTKMVRTVYIYYNNRSVQAVVELKNKPSLWHRAKKVSLQSGQTEVKIEFPLPITACNIMIEYADFYENIQASSETLQCPRCSAAVPANPGVCSNCGENVFQCHKCRAINYDEKDPFLCHACGFCKYAKFDFTLQAKPCYAVERIENDADRKKMVSNINTLLEKADRVYKQLMGYKPFLEKLVTKVVEQTPDKRSEEPQPIVAPTAAAVVGGAIPAPSHIKVNRSIQQIASQYCSDCKTSFEELSKIIQKVLVSRKELVAYDRKNRMGEISPSLGLSVPSTSSESASRTISRCYGCATASTEHCITLLRALALNPTLRQVLCSNGLIQELLANNLRKGSVKIQEDVRQLLCILSNGNAEATKELCNLITERVTMCLTKTVGNFGVSHEVALLAALQQIADDCWETRLRSLVNIFLTACEHAKSPMVIEALILPCLQIWHGLCKPKKAEPSKPPKAKSKESGKVHKQVQGLRTDYESNPIDVYKWVAQDPRVSYAVWRSKLPARREARPQLPAGKEDVRKLRLAEKYVTRWRRKALKLPDPNNLEFIDTCWLKTLLFNPFSKSARQITCLILEHCCTAFARKKKLINLLIKYLPEMSKAGENAEQYIDLFCKYLNEDEWAQYMAIKGVMITLADLTTREIEQLHRLEETTLTTNLMQGFILNQLPEILIVFIEDETIHRVYRGRLVGAVLNGYLSLRRLVVQRTRLIDATQERILDILEDMSTGTEEETRAFMCVCMETVEKCELGDVLTPVFIFERLCTIIYPEENDIGEFCLTLEKDAQQEDFLHGRMLGNPYLCTEAGMGPLMRDVKNKICQDCELVALLDDDTGMELLVNNKIMSLDLPVKDVYKKVWLAEGGDVESMRVIYRMRGLLGDATEEFVESLSNKSQTTVDNEEVFKMANVLAECGGLKVMVKHLGAITNIARAKSLLQVLLLLFRLSVKVVKVQEILTQPEVGAMSVFLRTLQLCLEGEPDSSQAAVTEQLLDIMETVLARATSKSLESFKAFSQTFGDPEYVKSLLSCASQSSVRSNPAVLTHLTRVLAALVYGSQTKMELLLNYFTPVLNFNIYDIEHVPADQQKLEMFCALTEGIERNAIGNTLKGYINDLGVVDVALEYITLHAPCARPTLLRTDSDELKEFLSKPSLKYILRFLTGMAHSHETTQLAISVADTIPIIHRLEQVSSDEHVGSLAENLLEALRTHPEVATKIEQVREFTRSEKKRMAMAMREKQLGQLGMRTNDKGQVTAKSTILQQMEELGEEPGLVCCICREGYKYQPAKVLAIYTFTKRCNVEEFEVKPRKTLGYNTVTHFNIVHVDCHMNAVRLARARDEWESAALQNANTKCNGLLPLWGPHVPESAFASCLARHNTYLQESTNYRDIGHASTVHDIKLLLLRFAHEKSFHEDTGGGGAQSNLHMIPYLIHMALYVINTTRVYKKEESNLSSYLELSSTEKIIESAYDSEGPLYWLVMSVLLHSPEKWATQRVTHLRRLLILAHVRNVYPAGPVKVINHTTEKEYAIYKPYLVMFGLVNGMYRHFFKYVIGQEDQWSSNLADYVRHNDESLLKASERLLGDYVDELLPCASFTEFCDVCGLLDSIEEPASYINNLLKDI